MRQRRGRAPQVIRFGESDPPLVA